jgi:hypothetical protein
VPRESYRSKVNSFRLYVSGKARLFIFRCRKDCSAELGLALPRLIIKSLDSQQYLSCEVIILCMWRCEDEDLSDFRKELTLNYNKITNLWRGSCNPN